MMQFVFGVEGTFLADVAMSMSLLNLVGYIVEPLLYFFQAMPVEGPVWMLDESGLSFYSHMIVMVILKGFWIQMDRNGIERKVYTSLDTDRIFLGIKTLFVESKLALGQAIVQVLAQAGHLICQGDLGTLFLWQVMSHLNHFAMFALEHVVRVHPCSFRRGH